MKTIEIIVSPDGQTRLQTKGFAGPGCREASRSLEVKLGTRLSDLATSDLFLDQRQERRRRSDLEPEL